MRTIVIDPVTRIEGHLKIKAVVDQLRVTEARCSGMLYRGFEVILRGRDPRDAQRITQRICGVCPTAHATASSLALDDAFGITEKIPHNGRLLRNLIFGANYLQSHILHFYQLAALDYVDVTAAAGYDGRDRSLRQVSVFIREGGSSPFLPRYEGDYRLSKEANLAAIGSYVEALNKRREAQEMLAIFGGKMPHSMGIFPGGALEQVTVDKIVAFRWRLNRLRDFVEMHYLPDIVSVARAYPDYFEIGRGCGNYMSYGGWDRPTNGDGAAHTRELPSGRCDAQLELAPFDQEHIREQVSHSWYKSRSGLHPSFGQTQADPTHPGGYSFLKSPRYEGRVYEVGPLARMLVAYAKGHPRVRELIDGLLTELGAGPAALCSVLGRHAARALECKMLIELMDEWALQLKPGEPSCAVYDLPESATGRGLTEAPRGSLGHWIEIKDGVIANYQAVVPTTWNCSPRDDHDQPGACEQALEGTKVRDADNPFELVRIVRSFDPCLACSVHTVTPRRTEIGAYRVV